MYFACYLIPQLPCCLQKAEAKRAVRNRRRETARWLNSVSKGDYTTCFAAATDRKARSERCSLPSEVAHYTTVCRSPRLLVHLQGQSARQRRRQGAVQDNAEQLEAERAIWNFVYGRQQSAESLHESERGALRLLSRSLQTVGSAWQVPPLLLRVRIGSLTSLFVCIV